MQGCVASLYFVTSYFGTLGQLSLIFCLVESYFLYNLGVQAEFQNPTFLLSDIRVRASEERRERGGQINTINTGHYVGSGTHSARTNKIQTFAKPLKKRGDLNQH